MGDHSPTAKPSQHNPSDRAANAFGLPSTLDFATISAFRADILRCPLCAGIILPDALFGPPLRRAARRLSKPGPAVSVKYITDSAMISMGIEHLIL
jgi:hypothetical protein